MRFLTLLLLFVLMLSSIAQAQDERASWEVTVYIPNEAAIVTLSAEGEINKIAVPEQANEILKVADRPDVQLSAGHRWLAFNQGENTGIIHLADLQAGTCCEEFGAETELPDGTKPGFFQLVGFSPDATKLALGTVQRPEGEFCEHCSPSASGYLVELATMRVRPAAQFIFGYESHLGWVEEGVVAAQHQRCAPGQMCVDPTYMSWKTVRNIETGETVSSTPIVLQGYTNPIGDTLLLTGEYISYHFYREEEWNPYVYYFPVVVYYAPEMDSWGWLSKPTFIYHFEFPETPSESDFMFMRWVLDGNAVLFRLHTDWNRATLLTRNGNERTFDIPYYHEFLAGTPDGWLMYEWNEGGSDPTPEAMSIFHYQYNESELTVSEIAVFQRISRSDNILLLDATPLGASVTKPFPTVELPQGIG